MRSTAGSLIAASALAVPALLGGGVASAEVAPQIVGGTAATGNTGWMASLQYNAPKHGRFAQHTCGGTLVFRPWVVTNAHCVDDQPGNTTSIPVADKQFFVRVGSKDRTRGGETAKVIKIVVHPGWNWNQDPSQPADAHRGYRRGVRALSQLGRTRPPPGGHSAARGSPRGQTRGPPR